MEWLWLVLFGSVEVSWLQVIFVPAVVLLVWLLLALYCCLSIHNMDAKGSLTRYYLWHRQSEATSAALAAAFRKRRLLIDRQFDQRWHDIERLRADKYYTSSGRTRQDPQSLHLGDGKITEHLTDQRRYEKNVAECREATRSLLAVLNKSVDLFKRAAPEQKSQKRENMAKAAEKEQKKEGKKDEEKGEAEDVKEKEKEEETAARLASQRLARQQSWCYLTGEPIVTTPLKNLTKVNNLQTDGRYAWLAGRALAAQWRMVEQLVNWERKQWTTDFEHSYQLWRHLKSPAKLPLNEDWRRDNTLYRQEWRRQKLQRRAAFMKDWFKQTAPKSRPNLVLLDGGKEENEHLTKELLDAFCASALNVWWENGESRRRFFAEAEKQNVRSSAVSSLYEDLFAKSRHFIKMCREGLEEGGNASVEGEEEAAFESHLRGVLANRDSEVKKLKEEADIMTLYLKEVLMLRAYDTRLTYLAHINPELGCRAGVVVSSPAIFAYLKDWSLSALSVGVESLRCQSRLALAGGRQVEQAMRRLELDQRERFLFLHQRHRPAELRLSPHTRQFP